ncbi:RpiB/LacA/LacB family sugar-phosphate isomerase [Candidatus Saccharibacteria bacterium]|nr:MAG: RpiB/LacA/LacB family sugar-phosphate isomerase [Candidatus Saccharibacteria bacterium]PID99247.1 MAG: RpiB/LacA/LacB family sugar-phosphate isomerase [Candidatus Saccharibacteria bacterium]
MKIYIGADHNGFDLKKTLGDYLRRGGYDVVDAGDNEKHPNDDFPQFAAAVVNGMATDESIDVRGVLITSGGQGMAMAANRFKGIRACVGWNQDTVRDARNDNDSNVLCLPAQSLDFEQVVGIVHAWLMTPFSGAPRYKRRIAMLDELGDFMG